VTISFSYNILHHGVSKILELFNDAHPTTLGCEASNGGNIVNGRLEKM